MAPPLHVPGGRETPSRRWTLEERCIWSHRRDPGTRPVTLEPGERYAPETYWVCPAHEEEFRRFHAYTARYGHLFLGLFGLIVVAGFGLVIWESDIGVALLLVGMAAVMLVFPFATPQTVRLMGARASVWLVRAGAVVILAWGVYDLVQALG